MNVQKVVGELKKKYPGKKVIITHPEDPTEIICEIKLGKEKSVAVAVIDKIRPHYHKKLTETYEVIKGELIQYLGNKKKILKEGESIKIPPGVIHWSEGNETWFLVYSTPGWTPEDHILVQKDREISREKFDN